MTVFLRSTLLLSLASLALAAQAAIGPPTVTFSQPSIVAVLPGSGSVVVDFSGTVTGSTLSNLTAWSGTTLNLLGTSTFVSPTSTYIPAIQTAISATGSYTGKLLSYTFASNAAVGPYATLTAPVTLGTGNTSPRDSNGTNLSILVTPVPEPSALAALGLGSIALLKRRKRA